MKKALLAGALLLSSIFLGIPKPVKAHHEFSTQAYHYYDDYNYYADAWVCTNRDPLNARYGPGAGYGVYTSFAKGTDLYWMDTAYDSYGNVWYQMSDGYTYGWVSGKYVCWY